MKYNFLLTTIWWRSIMYVVLFFFLRSLASHHDVCKSVDDWHVVAILRSVLYMSWPTTGRRIRGGKVVCPYFILPRKNNKHTHFLPAAATATAAEAEWLSRASPERLERRAAWPSSTLAKSHIIITGTLM